MSATTLEREAPAAQTAPPMPEVRGGVVAYLCLEGAFAASDFYVRAFGATEVGRMPPDAQGRTMHVHLYVNGTSVMLSDPFPEHGCGFQAPAGFNLMQVVDDVDASFARALEAGATVIMPPQDMFWGARYGQVRDPFGVTWALSSRAGECAMQDAMECAGRA
ncbi:VOC family protein [Roseomonas sp. CCTCC AB2023176]|uniref:VOC family protein n=1 Tax=Roseomonas sp. CCTCC AB2023176 TaxID=3342640 RepID=UPI0035D845AE